MKAALRIARRLTGVGLIVLALCGLGASSAMAAPTLEPQLERRANEVQAVFVRATSGQFRLRFGAGGIGVAETADLPAGASATAVQNALNGLANVASGGGSVSVEGLGNGVFLVTFDGGPLANVDVPELTPAPGSSPLNGGLQRVTAFTAFRAEVSRSDKRLDYQLDITNSGDAATSGTTAVEVALPAGFETAVAEASGTGWSCTASPPAGIMPAKATCTSAQVVPAGGSYPALSVVALLGADAPGRALAEAAVSGGGAAGVATDSDEFDFTPAKPFGIDFLRTEVMGTQGAGFTQAGGHPLAASATFGFNMAREATGFLQSVEPPKTVITDLPRGFVGNALAVPELCESLDKVLASECPPGSAIGEVNVDIGLENGGNFKGFPMVIYAIEPEFGAPVQFGFAELDNLKTTYTLTPRLRADDGYAISLDATPGSASPSLRRINFATICGFGARLAIVGGTARFRGCKQATDPDSNPVPLITNPTRCTGAPPTTRVLTDSWDDPGDFKSGEWSDPMPTGCDQVDFEPKVELTPTNARADSPTGMNVEIRMPTGGLESQTGVSQASLNNATVVFPRGMAVNPASAYGLGACTLAQLKLYSNAPDECPEGSKVGTVEVETPIIEETLTGDVYIAAQRDNPFNSTLGLYLVFDSPRDGIRVKVAGKLVPDPETGQLTSVFTENPEYPFSRLSLRFPEGKRAPLINPPRCGTYAIRSELSPWSAASPANPTPEEIVVQDSTYQVTAGPDGGQCPDNRLEPKLDAGLENATAGASSPFVVRLSRDDGSQRFRSLELKMPPGLVASLRGVPYCPASALAGIPGAELSGRSEQNSPACPTASQVGIVQAGAGAGPFPFYTSGRAYLAGPYKGAPLSLVAVTPAVAGPFDLGNVVIRNALFIDPATAQVTVVSDPIPTILHGLLLDIRDIQVKIDRPGFIQAPTNCSPFAVTARVGGADGASAERSRKFEVGNCAALGFKPQLDLRLFGGTKRGAYPRLRATLTARPGDANIAKASVALPHSAFLAQEHIRTICTRAEFAADQCPVGSVYGQAEAITPLLDEKLSGLVYLRSSANPLPDLVAVLKGPDHQPIEVELAGRIDSVHGGIRNSFDVVPDAPVSQFVLSMRGGKKSLLVNSRDVCKTVNRATAKFTAQNGRTATLRPKLVSSCKKKQGKKKGKKGSKPKRR